MTGWETGQGQGQRGQVSGGGVNKLEINQSHNLILAGMEDGVVEGWDHR
jgi:hypothetical protein